MEMGCQLVSLQSQYMQECEGVFVELDAEDAVDHVHELSIVSGG